MPKPDDKGKPDKGGSEAIAALTAQIVALEARVTALDGLDARVAALESAQVVVPVV